MNDVWMVRRRVPLLVLRRKRSELTQFGDLQVSLYPHRVDRGQRFHFVVKVKELVSVHEYPEPLVLAVDLDLEGRQRRRGEQLSEEQE